MTRARRTSVLFAAALLSVGACSGGGDDAAAPGAVAAAPASSAAPADAAAPGPDATAAPGLASAGDAAKITELARYVLLSKETPALCRAELSAKFVQTVFRSVTRCERVLRKKDTNPSDDAVDVRVSEVKVSGLAGTATVTEVLRDGDSATGTWAFIRAGDDWRVAAWGVDYLRSGFRNVFGPKYVSEGVDDVLAHAPTRACVGTWFERRDDASFARLSYGFLRHDQQILAEFQDQVLTCAAVPDATGMSQLRRVFEHHLRASVSKATSPEIAECGVRRTRQAITDRHLVEMERTEEAPAWLERRLKNIGLECALDQVRAAAPGGSRTT